MKIKPDLATQKNIESLRVLSSREFAEKARATLTHQLAKDMDRTITSIECHYIICLFDIGMNIVFPKETTNQ